MGIFLQDVYSWSRNWVFIVLLFGLCFGFLTFFQTYLFSKLRSVFLGILFLSLGVSLHYFNSSKSQDLGFNSNEIVKFKVLKKLNSNKKYKKYEVLVQVKNQTFNSILYLPREKGELDFEHYYQTKAYINKVESPNYDFQFDYAKYLQRRNIGYQVFANGELSSSPRIDLSITEKIRQKRLEVLLKINQSDLSPKSQEFLKGIILADRTEIDSETLQDFNRSGLVHFLAISGTHIVVIFGMLYFLLMKILPIGFRKLVIISCLIFIWVFALFIGFGNSVVRSCLMLTIYFIFVLLQRKTDLLHSLGLSALMILVIDTQQLFDVGFQLSFIAVLGIFWLNEPILKYLPKQNSNFKKLIYNTFSISIVAQLSTLPLVLYYFHQFSLISIVANFFVVPFSEVIIVFSFLMTGLFSLGLEFPFLVNVYDFLIKILLKSIHWFADFDLLFFQNIPFNLIELGALFGIVYLLRIVLIRFTIRRLVIWGSAVVSFYILRVGFNIYESGKEEVLVYHQKKQTIFSIKQNENAYFWIDNTVDKQSFTQFVVDPYVSSRRVKKVIFLDLPASSTDFVFRSKSYNLRGK